MTTGDSEQSPDKPPWIPSLSLAMVERLEELALRANSEGDYMVAESLLLQVLDFRLGHYGERHPSTIASLHDVGTNALGMGRWQIAYDYLAPAHELAEQIFGDLHPRTLALKQQLVLLRRLRFFREGWHGQAPEQGLLIHAN